MLSSAAATAADERRLRALFRSTAALRHCAGLARRPDRRGGASMTLGWPGGGGGLASVALGAPVDPTAADLGSVCAFYDRVAADLLSAHRRHAASA